MLKIAVVFVGVLAFSNAGIIDGIGKLWGHTPPKPKDEYWGPGEQPQILDESIRQFNINFDDSMIVDLKQRLANTRFPQPSLEGAEWDYGVNSNFTPTIVNYWLSNYDFKTRENLLNRYPQYLTNIQGLDIHFYHVKPELPAFASQIEVLPLLLVHGWPGSVVEFQKVIPLLTTPRYDQNFVFELIIPSIPGFGYSTPAAKMGLGPVDIANVMKNLMLRLGFDQFYVQGGDWGAQIITDIAALYPEHVLGMHSNLCTVVKPLSLLKLILKNAISKMIPGSSNAKVSDTLNKLFQATGFFHFQATKPDTLGVAVSDSPAGLAAYILAAFVAGTFKGPVRSNDGNLTDNFVVDDLIDNLMMYWAPNTISSSFRIYAEFASRRNLNYEIDDIKIKVPSVCAQFPNEIVVMPEDILRDRYANLVRVSKFPRGGHFAAMEEPQHLAEDLWTSVQLMRRKTVAK